MYVNGNSLQKNMTANPSKYPQGFFKRKPCKECSVEFQPVAPSHSCCSQVCQDSAFTRSYLRRNYGLTLEEWKAMFENQNHLCAICNKEGFKIDSASKNLLVVDHCHKRAKSEVFCVIIATERLGCCRMMLKV